MSTASNPIAIFTTTGADGEITNSPLFAAVKVTASLCRRFRTLAKIAQRHRIEMMQVQHPATEDPICWDFPPGSALEDCMMEESLWWLVGPIVYAELWGRLHMGDGGYTLKQLLATTMITDVALLEHLRAEEHEIEYLEHEGADDALGEPFALAVTRRVTAMRKATTDPPDY